MRRQTITVSSATSSATIPVNNYSNTFQIGIGCVISAGAVLTYKIQHTFDDIYDASITPTWFDHSVIVGQTANKDGNYSAPVAAVRLVVTAYTSGSVTATFLQN